MVELNNTGLLICIELYLFCIAILTVLFIYSIRLALNEKFIGGKLILLVNVCYGIVVDIDLINAVFSWSTTDYMWLSYLVNTIKYVMYILGALFWFLYCQRSFDSRLFDKGIFVALASMPAAIGVVLVLMTPFNGLVFSVSDNGVVAGSHFIAMQIISYIYLIGAAIFALIRIIKVKDADYRKRNRAIIIYAIPLIGADILQTATGYPFLCVGVCIALTMVFVDLIIEVYYKNENEELKRKQRRDALVSGLTQDYEAVFIVDADKDKVKLVRTNDDYILSNSHLFDDASYSEQIVGIIDGRVADKDKEDIISRFDAENVWKRLEDEKSYAMSFPAEDHKGDILYFRAKFVRLKDTDARRFLLGLRNADSEVRAQMELEKLREEKAVRESTSKLQSIIEALAYEYIILAVLNLDTGDMDKYRVSDNYKKKMVFDNDEHEYNTVLHRFANAFVEEEYREAFIREMDPDAIVEGLRDEKIYSVRFKLVGMDKWYEVNMSDYDASTRNVVIGGRNIDDVVSAERHREELTRELEDAKKTEFIAGLTQDFDCVSYIDVNDDFKETFYRTSPVFYNRIPESAKHRGFDVRMQSYAEIFVVPEDREKFLQEVATSNLMKRLEERPVYFVNCRISVDDVIRYYQVKFNANIFDGKIQSITAGFHDVDDEMKMELKRQEQLEKAKRAAEEGSQAKSLFLFNMSHDIRTPMNAIIGFTNIAMKNIDDRERAIDALKKTRESSDVLLSLINQILDMSRIESGKVVLAEDKADMLSFGCYVQPMLEELAENKNIDYTFDIDNIIDRYVILDRVRINEVIVNIVSNAIKYTQEGGNVRAHVRQLESDVDDYGLYEFSVADNGFGMSKEFQEHLFENFAREESSTTSGIEGTGLGLPLCKRIVDLMDGTIEVESEKDVGTTFTITLPFKKREHDVVDEEDYDETSGIDFNGMRILLAEDNDLNREIATEILKEEGFVVEDARNGREAVEKVRSKGEDYYDFILMDIRMPVMDGYEATKYIRGLCEKRRIPIIALSANAFEEDRAKSIKVGMDDHVSKPIEIDSLKRALARFV